jgi:hypothetical protein
MLRNAARVPIGWGGARGGAVALLALLALLAACSNLAALRPGHEDVHPNVPTVDRDTQVAVLLAGTIQTLQRLAGASPAEQAEIVATARQGYERAPGGGAQLRYALALATPGHAARDPEQARKLLRDLAAQPETLAPVERALTLFELAQLDRELGLHVDNLRLQSASNRGDQERLSAVTRKLQFELDDNARLRRLLDEAQAKLDAIANIERNLTERKSKPEGTPK